MGLIEPSFKVKLQLKKFTLLSVLSVVLAPCEDVKLFVSVNTCS